MHLVSIGANKLGYTKQFQLPVNLKEGAKQHDSKFFLQHLNLFRKGFSPHLPLRALTFSKKAKTTSSERKKLFVKLRKLFLNFAISINLC